jgi:hypothetical protein
MAKLECCHLAHTRCTTPLTPGDYHTNYITEISTNISYNLVTFKVTLVPDPVVILIQKYSIKNSIFKCQIMDFRVVPGFNYFMKI